LASGLTDERRRANVIEVADRSSWSSPLRTLRRHANFDQRGLGVLIASPELVGDLRGEFRIWSLGVETGQYPLYATEIANRSATKRELTDRGAHDAGLSLNSKMIAETRTAPAGR
jgi:hypothetical protein